MAAITATMSPSSSIAGGVGPNTALPPVPAMEPRFSLPDSTPRSSKTSIIIGGVTVYILGLEELQASRKDGQVTVLYLAHMRKSTYTVTENLGHEILYRYKQHCKGDQSRRGLIAVTMDMRNHGAREISRLANLTWQDGNETHASDLISVIDGSATDYQVVMSHLPSYLPQQFDYVKNVFMGVSLGAHTAYRVSQLSPSIDGYITVVGCPSLSSLLLSRLGVLPSTCNVRPSEMDKVDYSTLKRIMSPDQLRKYPKNLARILSSQDEAIFEHFPRNVPVLMCGGKLDPLVPTLLTVDWLDRRGTASSDDKTTLFVQENTGHSCTKEMVAMAAKWIFTNFS
ncbi:hypothetical protein BD324DRAFT_607725 [Kockovaella imperatae]|uniref:Alpha/Beta hydrolase protein n=1 Tax=Kockovaella imperatae TaxID=4999 RepID=A0A1Y1UPP9_9TREE|nr:hypothetical protein BD324DRAFT_607725 [Kockovaella imperatae]ORX39436.1 hypothetical protein BD324DRAFT_607725 [Kockovaella imperatae]